MNAGKRLWSYDLWRKPGEGGAPKRYLAAAPEALADAYSTMAASKRNVYEVRTRTYYGDAYCGHFRWSPP